MGLFFCATSGAKFNPVRERGEQKRRPLFPRAPSDSTGGLVGDAKEGLSPDGRRLLDVFAGVAFVPRVALGVVGTFDPLEWRPGQHDRRRVPPMRPTGPPPRSPKWSA